MAAVSPLRGIGNNLPLTGAMAVSALRGHATCYRELLFLASGTTSDLCGSALVHTHQDELECLPEMNAQG